jgi:hypothetical protein
MQVYLGSQFCPSVLEFGGLQVPARHVRDFARFMSPRRVKFVPLLDVHQLLILFAWTLTYSEPRTFSFLIKSTKYNGL